MKQGLKITIGSLALVASLAACGGKGAGSPASSANATVGCTVNSSGVCVGATGGILGQGEGKGRIVVSNVAKYQQFLLDNGMCSGAIGGAGYSPYYRQIGLPCNTASNYFDLKIQSVDNDPLPKPVNFNIEAFNSGRRVSLSGNSGYRMTQADIYGLPNGYQLTFNRQQRPYGGYPYYRPGMPIPQQALPSTATSSLIIVMTATDTTRTIFNVVVSYQGVQIGTGTFYGGFAGQLGVGPTAYGNGYDPVYGRTAPARLPYPRDAVYGDSGYDDYRYK